MKSLTKQKPFDEVIQLSDQLNRVFLIGCGTCATMTKTGGINEVQAMKKSLQDEGKLVTGWVVLPMACDEMTAELLNENKKAVQDAQCIIVMACALGVQRINLYLPLPVIPALDTLFIGMEKSPGHFFEACAQCGQCILGETAGICPLTACHKGLLNGPCGGTDKGKCEVDPEKDCAFTLIYERLKEQGRLDLMRKYHPPKNYQVIPRPRESRLL
ncbi:MAG: methylenetetrahydrofolate reductase C-terminal domain-containing protein [Dethiobacteria bacterium]|jgi:ferredoxin|nr:methylenetetrahydrofolate reductase C-terminal domain-containing protein [Bacillota bacterium]NMD33769.1 5,10-methylenetetrahydrofolate reductase [Bacillota bacterium]HOB28401.1 methylenetetrahydrofolate reductase C-terminal domain-containing protein [Bacillota bacterium]HPZ41220.1 methylenetetrahydrofolate reductase C-terminal domain-containing protein [Bacillota bacterium]HQD51951.1 methylenetetrahydrofolate reductase C-terminal domain-containing protein [Bacillota bacterium]